MATAKLDLIVTGDHGHDTFVYVEGRQGVAPSDQEMAPNLREAWVDAGRFWRVELDGGPGALIAYLRQADENTQVGDPFQKNEERPESIYLLTRQGKSRDTAAWRVGQAIVAGERTCPSCRLDPAFERDAGVKTPSVLMDFHQGWLDENVAALPPFLKGRRYIVRTHDPCHKTWRGIRESLQGETPGIWFSPIQDMAEGALWFAGNWESIRQRLLRHLQSDATLWDGQNWQHYVVIQVAYDGAFIAGPGMPPHGHLWIHAGDQPGCCGRRGYGAVVAGGVVFTASLVPALRESGDATRGAVIGSAKLGLARVRLLVEEGYEGPPLEEAASRVWAKRLTTNLPVRALKSASADTLLEYPIAPPPADWETAKAVVGGDERALKLHTRFRLGKLYTCDPEYACTLLQILSRVENHIKSATGVLSFAVFGEPGSGKSFMAKQIARVIDPDGRVFKELTFNLSQFASPDRLVDAFQQVQAVSSQAKIPFVLWDEFDSFYEGKKGGWLRQFLMPMQDAQFFDGSNTRPLGKCVFVFVGGTFDGEEEFQAWIDEEGRDLKGPDFHSRLDRSLSVPSVTFRGTTEGRFAAGDTARLQRALLVRFALASYPKLAAIDAGVLAYLLHVPLKHAARSLGKIIEASELRRTAVFRECHLPPVEVLRLHIGAVDKGTHDVFDDVSAFLERIGAGHLAGAPLVRLTGQQKG